MNDTPKIEIFQNQEFGSVRIVQDGEKYLFCAKDVALALGYRDTVNAIKQHCRGVVKHHLPTSSGTQTLSFITEGDVYRLIIRSKLPAADRFECWVFDEVLPTIRRHGAYATDSVLNNPELWEKVMQALQAEKSKRAKLQAENEQQQKAISALLPKARYCDVILRSKTAVPITLFAKDYGMSATRMNRLLHALDIQYKVRDCWILYQRYADMGFTVTHTYRVNETTCSMHTCWTQKGRLFLYELLCEHGVLPIMELTS